MTHVALARFAFRSRSVRACGAAVVLSACYMQTANPTAFQLTEVDAVQWNVANTDTGQVAAVAETSDDVVVFGSKGALIFAGGALATSDVSVTAWQPIATSIPAADGTGTWLVAVSASGRVLRLRARQTMEDVSDRYGLANSIVTGVAGGNGKWAVFSSDSGIAIADGTQMHFIDGALTGLSAVQHRAAGITKNGRVRVIDLDTHAAVEFASDHPVAVAFDAASLLWVETAHKLYRENAGALDLIYQDDQSVFHGLAFGGGRLWFVGGSNLGFVTQDAVMRAHTTVPLDATLFTSATGDVWAVSQSGLTRYGVPVSGDEATWRKAVLPVYARVCSQCHSPGGSSGIDLSTYSAWASRRADIYHRVLESKTMPQNQTLTADDGAAIAAWTKSTP